LPANISQYKIVANHKKLKESFPTMAGERAKSSIQVITRMMTLLDTLARQSAPINLKQLAAECTLHPSTAYRILNVMVQHRMVERVEPGTYLLGMRLLELGTLVGARAGNEHQTLSGLSHAASVDLPDALIRRGDDAI